MCQHNAGVKRTVEGRWSLRRVGYPDSSRAAAAALRSILPGMHRDTLTGCFGGAFRDADEYARYDPLALAATIDTAVLHGERVGVDVGTSDEFGLHAGVARFADIFAARGIVCVWHVVPDGGAMLAVPCWRCRVGSAMCAACVLLRVKANQTSVWRARPANSNARKCAARTRPFVPRKTAREQIHRYAPLFAHMLLSHVAN